MLFCGHLFSRSRWSRIKNGNIYSYARMLMSRTVRNDFRYQTVNWRHTICYKWSSDSDQFSDPRSFKRNSEVAQTWFRGGSNVIPRWLKRNSELTQTHFRAGWLEGDSEVTQKQFQSDSNAVLRVSLDSVSIDSERNREYIQPHACSGPWGMISVIKQLTGNTRYVTSGQVIATNLALEVIQT